MLRTKVRNYLAKSFRVQVEPIWHTGLSRSTYRSHSMYLLIVGSHCCVMHFAYVLHMCQQNFVPFPCLYSGLVELVTEVIFHYCTTPPCHKIDLFKRPFKAGAAALSASMMLLCCSLASSSFTLKKSLFLSDDRLNSRMYSVL